MRPLGEFSHASAGYILFRGKDYPPLYSEVVTSKGEGFGKVVDVIGPVSQPYFVVRPERELTEKLVGELKSSGLFVVKSSRRRLFGRKRPR